jgi:hypothetical protein
MGNFLCLIEGRKISGKIRYFPRKKHVLLRVFKPGNAVSYALKGSSQRELDLKYVRKPGRKKKESATRFLGKSKEQYPGGKEQMTGG